MHGDQDQTVKLAHSEILARALKRAGAEVTLVVIKGGGTAASSSPTRKT